MIYLLDTNAISDLMRASPGIVTFLARLSTDDRAVTCTVVRGKVLYGIIRLESGKRREQLENAARQILADFPCEPIPESAAVHYAELRTAGERLGRPIEGNDLWIAATAIALDATLVTRDTDFDTLEGLRTIHVG